MKTISLILATVLFAGCTSAPPPVTTTQQTIANAVEDTISIGLVPVLARNDSYLPAANATALALGSFSGTTLSTSDIAAFVDKLSLSDSDKRTVAALMQSAWATFQRRYSSQVGAALRPDVRLFLDAVARGILNAVSAVPPQTSGVPTSARSKYGRLSPYTPQTLALFGPVFSSQAVYESRPLAPKLVLPAQNALLWRSTPPVCQGRGRSEGSYFFVWSTPSYADDYFADSRLYGLQQETRSDLEQTRVQRRDELTSLLSSHTALSTRTSNTLCYYQPA